MNLITETTYRRPSACPDWWHIYTRGVATGFVISGRWPVSVIPYRMIVSHNVIQQSHQAESLKYQKLGHRFKVKMLSNSAQTESLIYQNLGHRPKINVSGKSNQAESLRQYVI